jgi:hypothetical protein
MHRTVPPFLALLALVSGCGGSAPPFSASQITIQDFQFQPATLSVPAGATVSIINLDQVPHTVTSAVAADGFVAGSVDGVGFDTVVGPAMLVDEGPSAFSNDQQVLQPGTAEIRIPASAPAGATIPYFSRYDLDRMQDRPALVVQ